MASATTLLLALGVAEGLLLAAALATRPERTPANRLLAALLCALSACVAVPLAGELGLWQRFPRAVIVLSGFPFWLGPLLLAYVALQVGETRVLKGRWLALHLGLPVAYVLVTAPFLALPAGELSQLLTRKPVRGAVPLVPILKTASIVAYAVGSLILLSRWEARLEDRLAETNPYALGWLRRLVRVALLFTALLAFVVAGRFAIPNGDTLFAATLSLLILALGLQGLRQPEIFLPVDAPREPVRADVLETADAPSAATPSQVSEPRILERLQRLGEDESVLFDPMLTLPKLARSIGASPHQVSFALNSGLGRSFYEHVNTLRADAVKKMLENPAHDATPILELAFACGFSTKATFNKAFKETTGDTPSAWRRHRGPSRSERTSEG